MNTTENSAIDQKKLEIGRSLPSLAKGMDEGVLAQAFSLMKQRREAARQAIDSEEKVEHIVDYIAMLNDNIKKLLSLP